MIQGCSLLLQTCFCQKYQGLFLQIGLRVGCMLLEDN